MRKARIKLKLAIFMSLSLLSYTGVHAAENGKGKETSSSIKEVEVKIQKNKQTVTITAKGKSGFHCNTLYPWKLTVEAESKEKKIFKKKDAKSFTKERVIFEIEGVKSAKAALKLSVCNDVQCIMHVEKLSW